MNLDELTVGGDTAGWRIHRDDGCQENEGVEGGGGGEERVDEGVAAVYVVLLSPGSTSKEVPNLSGQLISKHGVSSDRYTLELAAALSQLLSYIHIYYIRIYILFVLSHRESRYMYW